MTNKPEATIYTGAAYKIGKVERSEWKVECGDVIWIPRKGMEPNWFHRWTQRLVFGLKWSKHNESF